MQKNAMNRYQICKIYLHISIHTKFQMYEFNNQRLDFNNFKYDSDIHIVGTKIFLTQFF